MEIVPSIREWLLEPEDPSVRWRTLTCLLERGADDPEVVQARAAIPDSKPVSRILAKMQPDGTWLQRNPRTREMLGGGVEYGAFATTHFCLAYLAELGLDRTHPQVAKAAERYLALQAPDGDWYLHLSCLLGYNVRTFTLLGYRDDPHVQRAIDLLLETEREDGGYLCDLHERKKYKTRPVKSCVRGAVKVLLALAELPEYWDHPRCWQLVDYFLRRGGIFRSTDPGRLVNADMERATFPIIWRANTWEILYALSKMGYGRDERLHAAWEVLGRQADASGRYLLDWTPAQSPWKFGERGEVNKWITLYVLLAKKYRG